MLDGIFVPNTDNVHHAAREQRIIADVGKYLAQEYPRHWWHVECNWHDGVVKVRLPDLETMFPQMRQSMRVIPLARLDTPHSTRQEAIRAGGIILECYNLARKGHELGDYETNANPVKGGGIEASRHYRNMRELNIPLVKITTDDGVAPLHDDTPVNIELIG